VPGVSTLSASPDGVLRASAGGPATSAGAGSALGASGTTGGGGGTAIAGLAAGAGVLCEIASPERAGFGPDVGSGARSHARSDAEMEMNPTRQKGGRCFMGRGA